ncbi:MAG TPA: hypothetical protein VKM55_09035 [Candidatus Lokiarchaeia archaeon]|nr:hypothetical protein [Candidatus Lokiarchaeia archaeon]
MKIRKGMDNTVSLNAISDEQALEAIKAGEFGSDIIASKPNVAVILTQSWCPQWQGMRNDLEALDDPDIDVWLLIYDRSSVFDEFLSFKENVLCNDEIPYIRYYKDGVFVSQSNAVSQSSFLNKLKEN